MLTTITTTILIVILVSPVAPLTLDDSSISALGDQRTCEPIKIEHCRNLGYNQTGMPNLVGHELQIDAELQFATFLPLIQYGCSSKLRFFLCSVYTPMCTEKVVQPIGPCRSLCESVKSKCNSILVEFGFYWPSALNCSKFPPSNNQENMCMDGPDDEDDDRWRLGNESIDSSVESSEKNSNGKQNHFGLCRGYKFSEKYYFINRSERCAHECDADILYSSHNKDFTLKWIAGWSIVCFLSSVATVASFMRSTCKSYFHERIILYLAANYTMYSLAFILRLAIGRDGVSCQLDQQHGASILTQDGLDGQFSCTVIFVLIYFFGMSSMVWWTILCLCLYLINGKGRGCGEMDSLKSLFHLAAWGLPALKTIAILVGVPFGPSVDADELTGLCYVGNQRTDTLMIFVIVPSALYLAFGSFFLLMASVKKRTSSVHQPSQLCLVNRSRLGSQVSCFTQNTSSDCDKVTAVTDQLKIFAFFFAVPAACILSSNIYDYLYRDSWYFINRSDSITSALITSPVGGAVTTSTLATKAILLTSNSASTLTTSTSTVTSTTAATASSPTMSMAASVPNVELFILKFFMSLIVGLLVWAARLLLGSNSSQVKIHQKKKLPAGVIQSMPYGDLTRTATAASTTARTALTGASSSAASSISYSRGEETFVLPPSATCRPLASSLAFSSQCSFIIDPRMRPSKPETPV